MLKYAGKKHTLTCNEPDQVELFSLADRIRHSGKDLDNVYLNDSLFPNGFQNFPPQSLDVIVAHRVLPIMRLADAKDFLTAAYDALKPGGALYIVAISITHSGYIKNITPSPERVSTSTAGFREVKTSDALPAQAYILPDTMVFVEQNDFSTYLKSLGYEFRYKNFIATTKSTGPATEASERKGQENIAIIARKPSN